eukprot:1378197-Rhodomonas_salina.2
MSHIASDSQAGSTEHSCAGVASRNLRSRSASLRWLAIHSEESDANHSDEAAWAADRSEESDRSRSEGLVLRWVKKGLFPLIELDGVENDCSSNLAQERCDRSELDIARSVQRGRKDS